MNQMFKIINRGKPKGCRLLAVEGVFTAAGGKNPTELSNLCRLVFKANDTTGEATKSLTANLPMSEFPAVLEGAKMAFKDFTTVKNKKFQILEPQLKPKTSDTTEDGTLLYSVGIEYDSSRTYPVTITVKNCRGTVTEKEDGTLRIIPTSKEQPYISVFMTAREFYNKLSHVDKMFESWYNNAQAEFYPAKTE